MNNENTNEKPKPNQKKYLIGQYVANLIGALIVTLVLVGLCFSMFGDKSPDLIEVQLYMLVFIPCFMMIQCHTALMNTRKDYLKGKWVMEEGESAIVPDSRFNPWRRIRFLALPSGLVTAVATCFAVPYIVGEPVRILHIDLLAFVPLFVVSTILIGIILPRDQASFTAALKKPRQEQPRPFGRYFFIEHIGSWMILQGVINLGIGLKQFDNEMLKPEHIELGGVSASVVAPDLGIVFGIIIFFMFLSSDGQVRLDVNLGRISERSFTRPRLGEIGLAIVAPGVLVTTVLIMAITGAIMTGVFYVAGVEVFSVAEASVLKTVAAVLGCIAGCGIGIWWGTRRETALIRAEDGSNE